MTAKTWLGGGNNRASNPVDWSPAGAPVAGDTLSMNGGTMTIRDHDLPNAGQLSVTGTSVLNISNATVAPEVYVTGTPTPLAGPHGDVTINASGTDHFGLGLFGYDSAAGATVDLAQNARWVGGFNVLEGSLTVNGLGAQFINQASPYVGLSGASASLVRGSLVKIAADVCGHGAFELDRIRGATGRLEFGASVGREQSVVLHSGNDGQLVVDKPGQFHAAVSLLGDGDIDLVGLVKADAASFKNDMLTITSAGRVVDVLRMSSALPFSVEQTATGVSIFTPGDTHHGMGTMLPLH